MVGSLIQVGSLLGIVVDATISTRTGVLVHKIKWLADRNNPYPSYTWRVLKNLTDLKVLVKEDLYGEEQAGL
jgi:hypothetical protein